MFLHHQPSKMLVEVLDVSELSNPLHKKVLGRFHAGEELQDPEPFTKAHLCFLSGEPLPQCWVDVQFRDHMQQKVAVMS